MIVFFVIDPKQIGLFENSGNIYKSINFKFQLVPKI